MSFGKWVGESPPLSTWCCRSMLAPPMSACIDDTNQVKPDRWRKPDRLEMEAGIPRDPLLPAVKGHFWDHNERHNLITTSGPVKWPLVLQNGEIEEIEVWDPKGPAGMVRSLSYGELWRCQGRRDEDFARHLAEGWSPYQLIKESLKATGSHTAMSLVLLGGFLKKMSGDWDHGQAGGDRFGEDNLHHLLQWLLAWKRGSFPRARSHATVSAQNRDGVGHEARAGGFEVGMVPMPDLKVEVQVRRPVWRWGEALWAEDSDSDSEDEVSRKGGARNRHQRNPEEIVGQALVDLDTQQRTGFDSDVGTLIGEWIDDENLQGHLSESTSKQYAGLYGKWKAWVHRQSWKTEFLNKKEPVEENEDKILGFLGYLGWLGSSVATLKQAVFAIKEAHKRGGVGDPTDGMHRLWMLLGAMERKAPHKPRRLGVTPAMLRWLGKSLAAPPEEGNVSAQDKIDGAVFRALLFTAWFFMMRAKEYADSNGVDANMILRGCDVKFVAAEGGDMEDNIAKDKQGAGFAAVTVQFRKTKTDQEAFGTCKTHFCTSDPELCVVRALLAMKIRVPQRFENGREALQPLFRWTSGKVIKRVEVQNALQRAARAVGLPPGRFMSHSLRIGGASALYRSTGEIELVKRTGRWSSSAVQRYLFDGGIALKDVANKMAAVEQKVHFT